VISPSTPGEGKGRDNDRASHNADDPCAKLGEDIMTWHGLDYPIVKGAAKQLGGKTLILLPKQTFMTRMSRILECVQYRSDGGRS
jgi:hypothetical protein